MVVYDDKCVLKQNPGSGPSELPGPSIPHPRGVTPSLEQGTGEKGH